MYCNLNTKCYAGEDDVKYVSFEFLDEEIYLSFSKEEDCLKIRRIDSLPEKYKRITRTEVPYSVELNIAIEYYLELKRHNLLQNSFDNARDIFEHAEEAIIFQVDPFDYSTDEVEITENFNFSKYYYLAFEKPYYLYDTPAESFLAYKKINPNADRDSFYAGFSCSK